jgi:glyceraldehyde 3-phosphate dehydrogenase
MKRIAINGMGRIGRASLKIILDTPGLELVAVNDIASAENIAYLIRYDSVHGTYPHPVTAAEGELRVGDQRIRFLSEKDPQQLPWEALGIDVVIESTGVFTSYEDAQKHLRAGARTVVLSGPSKSPEVPTVVHGVNGPDGETRIFSCASCTTNNISPLVEILGRRIGIRKAIMTTVHAYTASQKMVDGPSKKDLRMGRAGAANLVPTSTGAAKATTRALPEYAGRFDGIAIRTPVAVGSISDVTLVTARPTTVEEVNDILTQEAATARYRNVLAVTTEPLVSSDIVKSPYASIADLSMTRVVDGDLLKVLSWYDNEWGFSNQMIRQIREL